MAAATLRGLPAPPGAPLRKDGSAPPSALSAARSRGASAARRGPKPIHHSTSSWMFKYFDPISRSEADGGPITRAEIEQLLCMPYALNMFLSEHTLVRPLLVFNTQPYVTIRKMVACGWKYPGPAEGH